MAQSQIQKTNLRDLKPVASAAAVFDTRVIERLGTNTTVTAEPHTQIPVHAPWTGAQIGSIPRCLAADVALATKRARAAQPAWHALPYRQRGRIILRFHDLLLARQPAILDLMQLETGKARKHALEEVIDTAMVARHYAFHGERQIKPRRRRGAFPLLTATWEQHHPCGVVGIIAPWNYPLTLAVTDAIPALLAGNAVVLKPDSQTAFTALWAVNLMYEAGLPRDLFQIVTGDGPETGPLLIDAVDFVTFTGSTATGRTVARQAAERLIGCSLELGGKNAMVVFPDADIKRAVAGAVHGCFASAGQLCISIERLYVHDAIYDRFVEPFVECTRRMRLGPGFSSDVDIGALAGSRQMHTVREHVDDAVAHGATLLAGGKPRPDLGPTFFEPTILADVTPQMKLFKEETFGPVVALYRFSDTDDVIDRVNATRYGLNASLWTRNLDQGRALAKRIEAGTVNINETYTAAWGSVDAPMGGFKDSGLSRRHGAEGILKYTQPQTIAVQRGRNLSGPGGIISVLGPSVMSILLRLWRHIPGLR